MDIRVAIFEDNKLVRDALNAILNGTQGYICCASFPNGDNWDINVQISRPDVILMDIEMPGLSGIELSQNIKIKYPDIKILVQTVFADNDKIFNALCAGASGYILKNEPPHKYMEAINEVYSGGAPMSAAIAKKVLSFFTSKNIIIVQPGTEDYHLSEREGEILKMMVDGDNFYNIAKKAFISYETVRTHVKRIYKKMHVASKSEAVMKALQKGIF
ncbi:MAG: response regulator transcription factor [Saprospiraceae bacterium]